MIKKIFFFFIVSVLTTIFTNIISANNDKAILYYGKGCPHCANIEQYLKENNINLEIEKKEIYQNVENAQEFNKICENNDIALSQRGVPFLYIGQNEYYVGDTSIISYLENLKTKNIEKNDTQKEQYKSQNNNILTIPILISAALVDAINPCAFAVLIILMSTVLYAKGKKRALFSGIAFSISIFISYLLMGLGLYSIMANIETSEIFIKIIGTLAIIIGILNLKDYFWYGKVFLMEVPLSWRPKLKALIRSITGPIGAFFIGFLVSLFLLPCTSGPYIVIIGMLGEKTTYFKALLFLILYNIIFVLPMIAITIGVYFGLNTEKVEEIRTKNLQILHLIAGIIMFIMGIILIIEY